MRLSLIVALLLSAAPLSPAADPPAPRVVQQAEGRRDATIAKARHVYLQATLDAERLCIQQLQAAALDAGKSGNTDLVLAIAQATKAAETRYDRARIELDGTMVYDFRRPDSLDHFVATGASRLISGTGLEFPNRQWSNVVSKERFTFPIVATFEVYAEADGTVDISPRIFVQGSSPNLDSRAIGLHLGDDWNRKTDVTIFDRSETLPHTAIQAGHSYFIRISVDRAQMATIDVDGHRLYETKITDASILSGPIMLTGGAGHVVYTRVAISAELSD